MIHVDYTWDLYPDRIVLDEELNIDRLGWKGGDYFKLINVNGKPMLVKEDALIKFLKDGKNNVQEK